MNTSPAKKRRGPGHPPHEPTQLLRNSVTALVTSGLPQERIAAVIGIDKKTLQRHYRKELDTGREESLSRNTISLMEMARKGNAAAAIYLQKCLGGSAWREKQQTEHEGEVVIKVVYGERD